MNNKQIRKNGNERRTEILQAALDIIAEYGLEQLTIAALAERVGISDAGILKYFSGKSDIIYEVTASFTDSLLNNVKLISGMDCSALTKIDELFRMHWKTLIDNFGVPRLIFVETIHLRDERVRQIIMRTQQQFRVIIAKIITQGVKEGSIRSSIDIDSAAFAYQALIQFNVSQYLLKRADAEDQQLFDGVKSYYISSLLI